MSSKLSKIDKEILSSNLPFDYNSIENTYFGGYFGSNSEDYVEVMIYDTNDNLLETSVADSEDYYYDSEKDGVKLKTGTILRKLGYDRGRFKVTYNFLRKLAGSYQTVVTDQGGNIFNDDVDIDEIDKTLFIKEDKYITHQISPTRTEIRLVTQNIRDEKYIRDFYRLAAKNKKVKADSSDASNIEFAGTADDKSTSNQLKFVPVEGFNEGVFEQSMVGGTITIPNFFLVDRIYPPPIPTADDVGLFPQEVIGSDVLQACFFLDPQGGTYSGIRKKNGKKSYGDTNFSPAFVKFKDITDDQEITEDGFQFQGDGRTLNDIRNLNDSDFDCVYVKRDAQNDGSEIDIVSNSFLRANTATSYTWQVTGFDKQNGKYKRITPRPEGVNAGGDFRIISPSDEYATRSSRSQFVANQTILPDATTSNATVRDGSRLKIQVFAKDVHIGIKLTIKDNTSRDESTIHLPAIIEGHD